MKSVPSRRSVGSTPVTEEIPGKRHAIRYRAAILVTSPLQVGMRTTDPALPRIGTDFMIVAVLSFPVNPV